MNTAKLLTRLLKRGLTGIETAIILIAIVLVAAAFAFVVMNMGFGSVQKTGEAITKGTEEASASLEVAGTVLAVRNQSKDYVVVYLRPGIGGVAVNVNTTVVTIITETKHYVAANDTVEFVGKCGNDPIAACKKVSAPVCYCVVYGDGDSLLEQGERFAMVVKLSDIGVTLRPYMKFTIEIKPEQGAVLRIPRTVPPFDTKAANFIIETW